jgi:DNA invertase Pin-like site-specific DNA recombinase
MQTFTKIIGYIRVSTAEQAADGRTSLQAQESAIKGVAMIHGIEQVEVYADPGVSGAIPLNERPGGARLAAALEPGVLVIASKLDRVFRSASDALQTVDAWKQSGVHLVLVDLGVDPVSSNGASKMFFGILASVAEFERSRIAERMCEGRQGKRARGGHIGGAVPYGFRKIGEGRAALLQRDEAEQSTLAHIKNLRASRCTYQEMIELLTARGMYLRTGKPWTNSQLHRVLHAAPRDGVIQHA